VRLKVLALPKAKDPDELIRADPHAWPALVHGALPVVDFVLSRLEARHDLSSAQGKAAAANEVAEVLSGIANPIEQDAYVNDVATRLGVEPAAVRRLLGGRQPARRAPSAPRAEPESTPSTPSVERGDPNDDYLLALLMRLREIPESAPLAEPPQFMLPESRALFDALGGPIPPELDGAYSRASRYTPLVAMLPTPVLREHIELKLLEIRRTKLEREHAEVSALLKGGAITSEEAQVRLNATLQKIAEIATQLPPERERAGFRS
jgi:DNA primase